MAADGQVGGQPGTTREWRRKLLKSPEMDSGIAVAAAVCRRSRPKATTRRGDLAAQLGRHQRGQLFLVAIAGGGPGKSRGSRGVSVNFGDALGQMRDQPCKSRKRHGAAPGEPENLIGRGDAGALQTQALKAGPRGQRGRRQAALAALDPREHASRLERRANGRRAKFRRHGQYRREDRGMQVKMLVSVDVVKRETGCAEGLELGAHLRQHLPAHMGQKKHRRAGASHVRPQSPAGVQ